jgi:serine O-acetyltransferase
MRNRTSTLRSVVRCDLYRYAEKAGIRAFVFHYLLSPGFQYTVWFRIASTFPNRGLRYLLHRKSVKLGISIPVGAKIGGGFYIGHFGGIVVSPFAVIGENCNISHGVTIGRIAEAERAGAPVVGNRVYIGPDAKVIGKVAVGDDAAIGANAVVTKDVPANAVVGGVPAAVLSMKGSGDYIQRMLEVENG